MKYIHDFPSLRYPVYSVVKNLRHIWTSSLTNQNQVFKRAAW